MLELPNKKKNIKELWQQLNNDGAKTRFLELCALEFDKSKKTCRQWWFSNYGDWSVPEEHQDRVIYLLQNTIKHQS